MLVDLSEEGREQQAQILLARSHKKLLSQCNEECCELAVACNKAIRVIEKDTPITWEEALAMIEEEVGDVLLQIDYLAQRGLLDLDAAIESAKRKNTRWYGRTIGR